MLSNSTLNSVNDYTSFWHCDRLKFRLLVLRKCSITTDYDD